FKLTSASLLPLIFVGIFSLFIGHNFSNGFISPGAVIASLAAFLFLCVLSNNFDKYINNNLRNVISKVSQTTLGVYIIYPIVSNFLLVYINDTIYSYHL